MNEVIIKRAVIFSLILGASLGVASAIPFLTGYCLFIVMALSAPVIIIYMKNKDKYLGIINNEESAILGGIIGFSSMIGFFLSFSPLVCVLKFMIKTYYAYMIPDMLSTALWLFIVIVVAISGFFAATNAVSAMALSWIYSKIEKNQNNESIDMKIED